MARNLLHQLIRVEVQIHIVAELVYLVQSVYDGAPLEEDVGDTVDEHAREGRQRRHVQEVVQQSDVVEADNADDEIGTAEGVHENEGVSDLQRDLSCEGHDRFYKLGIVIERSLVFNFLTVHDDVELVHSDQHAH